jgi:hypothetical protein
MSRHRRGDTSHQRVRQLVVDRERYLLLLGALAACHEARASGTVTLSTVPRSPPPEPTFCESLAKKNDTLFANPENSEASRRERAAQCGAEENKRVRTLLVDSTKRPAFLTYCHESKGGTWAVVLVSVSLDDPGGEGPPCGWAATYKLVHVRDAMKAAGIATSSARQYRQWLNEQDAIKVVGVDDHDDGQAEIVLSETLWQNGQRCLGGEDECGLGDATLERLRVTADKVEPYHGLDVPKAR